MIFEHGIWRKVHDRFLHCAGYIIWSASEVLLFDGNYDIIFQFIFLDNVKIFNPLVLLNFFSALVPGLVLIPEVELQHT